MSYSFTFNNPFDEGKPNLAEGTFIWIIHANKIPPHIGISTQGKFFSLKTSGKDDGIELNALEVIIERRTIATVLVALENKIKFDDVKAVFDKYVQIPTSESCLLPINELVEPNQKFGSISELLTDLSAASQIKSFFGINLPNNYVGIPFYGKAEIESRIRLLRDAKREKNIPA